MAEGEEPKPEKKKPHPRLGLILALAIFAAGFALRLFGIGWALPNDERNWSLHPDEPILYLYSRQVEPARLDFTPGFYNYGTLYLTVLRVSTDIAATYQGVDTRDELAVMKSAHQAGRFISAAAGAGIGVVVLALLWRRTNPLGASMGAAAAAIAPGLVVHSRFQTVDVLATLLAALSLWYASRLDDEGELPLLKWAGLAGLFAGLSAGAKYTGILALAALAAVAIIRHPKSALKMIGIGLGAAIGALVVTTPGILLETQIFLKDFKYETVHTSEGHGLVFAATSPGFIYHLVNLFTGFGLLMTLAGAFGLGRAAFRRHAWAIGLVAFAVLYYILIGRAEVKFLRYVFPLIPVLAVGLGWLIGRAHEHPKAGIRFLVPAGILAIAGPINGGLLKTAVFSYHMSMPDVRDDVGARMLKLQEPGERIGLVSDPWFYTPTIFEDAAAPRPIYATQIKPKEGTSDLPYVRYESPSGERLDWDVRLLTEEQPDYVAFSSFEAADMIRLSRLEDRGVHGESVARYEEFMAQLREDYEGEPVIIDGVDAPLIHDLMYIRPTVWVWKRKTTDSPTP